ncbi:MAG: multiheme c-type cytochrome [Chloroflexota bacterium]
MSKKRKKRPLRGTRTATQSRRWLLPAIGLLVVMLVLLFATTYDSYASVYDAEYVGSETCGECHTITYQEWKVSPHANMTRRPTAASVVGDFTDGAWMLPAEARQSELDDKLPAARMYQENGNYYMALREPDRDQYVPFKVDYVIGYQYRQVYLTQEPGGVLRRLPLQWSTERQDYFSYWNFQENSTPYLHDLWAQMESGNSAWNLFCARCHTTKLTILDTDPAHTDVTWVDAGIACEACHGPGSHHADYFQSNYVNRIVAFVNGRLRGEPVAYIANPPKQEKGEALSVCARCHGPDVTMNTLEVYRTYEPGYSAEGRINDLSPYFKQLALEPGRIDPTVEVWADGQPKGIAMIFRSFIESDCYAQAEVRCYDCHNPHNNKAEAVPGILQPSAVSNDYCLQCHTHLKNQLAGHTKHEPGTAGSFCYDCHMPNEILSIVTGVPSYTRTHLMSSLPDPQNSAIYGLENAPNACTECHADQSVAWAVEQVAAWNDVVGE